MVEQTPTPRSRFSLRVWLVFFTLTPILIALLIAQPAAVWTGRDRLTITIKETEAIDRDFLLFAYAWSEEHAEYSLDHPGGGDNLAYSSADYDREGNALFDISTSGRRGYWGIPDTYTHPEHLVVEYRLLSDKNAAQRRKRFAIPKGRGPRTMNIVLP